MSFKNRWTISSSYEFQAHQQCCQSCCISQTAEQGFEMLPGLSLVLPDVSLALPDMSLALPALLSVHPDLPSALSGLSPALPAAPRLCVGAPRCSPGWHQTFYGHIISLLVLPGAPEGHCITTVHSGIWPPCDSGPTTSRHSQVLPEAPRGSQEHKYILLMDALQGHDRASFEMHLEAEINQPQRSTVRTVLSEIGYPLAARDQVSLEMDWWPWLSEIGAVRRGGLSGGSRLGGWCYGTQCILY